MNKHDILSGDIVVFRNGKISVTIKISSEMYFMGTDGHVLSIRSAYTTGMESTYATGYDISRIYRTSDILDTDILEFAKIFIDSIVAEKYLIYKREKYVTFDEARKSGKYFKHKTMKSYWRLDSMLSDISDNTISDINELLDSKEWIIED